MVTQLLKPFIFLPSSGFRWVVLLMWTLHDSGTHLFLLFAPHSTPDLPPRAADRPPLQSSACLDASPAPASLPTLAVGPPSSCIESSSYVRIVKLLCGLATSMPVDHRSKAPPPFDRLDSAGTDAVGPKEHHYELCECREPATGGCVGEGERVARARCEAPEAVPRVLRRRRAR